MLFKAAKWYFAWVPSSVSTQLGKLKGLAQKWSDFWVVLNSWQTSVVFVVVVSLVSLFPFHFQSWHTVLKNHSNHRLSPGDLYSHKNSHTCTKPTCPKTPQSHLQYAIFALDPSIAGLESSQFLTNITYSITCFSFIAFLDFPEPFLSTLAKYLDFKQ